MHGCTMSVTLVGTVKSKADTRRAQAEATSGPNWDASLAAPIEVVLISIILLNSSLP